MRGVFAQKLILEAMFSKLLKTRFFARGFNRLEEGLGDRFSGVILAYIFALPIMYGALAFFDCLVWSLPFDDIDIFQTEQEKNAADFVSVWILFFSASLAAFFIRFFARGFSSKGFLCAMLLPLFFCLFALFAGAASGLDSKQTLWFLAEGIIVVFVFARKDYTGYRAFQAVGSLFLIIIGLIFYCANLRGNRLGVEIFGGSKIFLALIIIFWVLSTAHILFRDALLDYLESKEK